MIEIKTAEGKFHLNFIYFEQSHFYKNVNQQYLDSSEYWNIYFLQEFELLAETYLYGIYHT